MGRSAASAYAGCRLDGKGAGCAAMERYARPLSRPENGYQASRETSARACRGLAGTPVPVAYRSKKATPPS